MEFDNLSTAQGYFRNMQEDEEEGRERQRGREFRT